MPILYIQIFMDTGSHRAQNSRYSYLHLTSAELTGIYQTLHHTIACILVDKDPLDGFSGVINV